MESLHSLSNAFSSFYNLDVHTMFSNSNTSLIITSLHLICSSISVNSSHRVSYCKSVSSFIRNIFHNFLLSPSFFYLSVSILSSTTTK
nr:MAG TPA: hypothetical protein [Caudoviricetes sp.]